MIGGKTTLAVPVIFDNGSPVGAGVISDSRFPQFEADNFILDSGKYYLTDIHWWGFYAGFQGLPTAPDDFSIQIYKFNGTSPEVNPSYVIPATDVRRELFEDNPSGSDIFSYYLVIDPIQLEPSTPYLLSIVNNTQVGSPFWVWNSSNLSGVETAFAYYRYSNTGTWTRDPYDELAFSLTGRTAVPEPSTLLLLASGLAGLGGVAWRRHRRA